MNREVFAAVTVYSTFRSRHSGLRPMEHQLLYVQKHDCDQILQRGGPTMALLETREIIRLIAGGNLIAFHSKEYQ